MAYTDVIFLVHKDENEAIQNPCDVMEECGFSALAEGNSKWQCAFQNAAFDLVVSWIEGRCDRAFNRHIL